MTLETYFSFTTKMGNSQSEVQKVIHSINNNIVLRLATISMGRKPTSMVHFYNITDEDLIQQVKLYYETHNFTTQILDSVLPDQRRLFIYWHDSGLPLHS
jgi:hypothetical protein